MTWYKFLAPGAVGPFSGRPWPTPRALAEPGAWMAASRLEPCRSGLHLCRAEDLPFWMSEELYTVEVDGGVVPHDSFVLARRARLLEPVPSWGRDMAIRFCRDCTARVRDLAAATLRASGRRDEADTLAACEATDELATVAERIAGRIAELPPLLGYAQDAAHFTAAARTQARWSAGAATTAFVAATAASVAADGSAGPEAAHAERRRQGEWLTTHLLAAR